MNYRPEITGLRAIAVLPVILFHGGFSAFAGGFVGVDVFFVISGFLITTIIVHELTQDRFSIARFYERRARRILPALTVVMAVSAALAWVWMLPSQFEEFSRSLIAVSLFISNIYFWRNADYFGPVAEESLMLHTWSLAIEEQFYVLFPIFMIIAFRFGRQPLFWALVLISLASLLLSEWGSRHYPEAAFYLLPTRAWELLVGALCALFLYRRAQVPDDRLALCGLAMIVASILLFHDDIPFPSVYALLPVGGTALILLYGSAGGLAGWLLTTRLMVGIGLISYSAYLWHQPLFALARIRSMFAPAPSLMLALAVASLALAYVTWRFVEQPFRSRGRPVLPTQRSVFVGSLTAIFVFSGAGLFGVLSEGRQALWARANPDKAEIYRMIATSEPHNGIDDGRCRFRVRALTPEVRARIAACFDEHGPTYLVLGDSHAEDLFGALTALDPSPFVVGFTNGGCRPFTRRPWCQYETTESFLRERPEIFHTVLYSQAGNWLLHGLPGDPEGRARFEHVSLDAPVPNHAIHEENIAVVADYLSGLVDLTGAKVYWLGPRVEPHIPQDWIMLAGCDYPFTLRENQLETFQTLDRHVAAHLRGSSVGFVSQIDILDFDPARDIVDCETIYWFDGDHWTAAGEHLFGSRLFPHIEAILARM